MRPEARGWPGTTGAPALAAALNTSARLVGLLVAAYALPYGVMALGAW